MSALDRFSDSSPTSPEVRVVPKPVVSSCSKATSLLDHLVGDGEQRRRHIETERLSGLEVHNKLIPGRRLHRQVSRLLASENAIDIRSGTPEQIGRVNPKRDEPAIGRVKAEGINRWNAVTGGEANDQITMYRGNRAGQHNQTAIGLARELFERTFDFGRIANAGRDDLHPESRRRCGDRPKESGPCGVP